MSKSFLKIAGGFILLFSIISVIIFSLFKGIVGGGVERKEIEEIISEYIMENPQLLLDSVQEYQRRMMEEDQQEAQDLLDDKIDEVENNPDDPIAGNAEGDVVVVEFFDYSCGYCKRVFPVVKDIIEQDKNVKVVFKEFPILGQSSLLSAQAALAVHLLYPEKYFDVHAKLMESRARTQEDIDKILKQIKGVNLQKVKDEMNSARVEKIVLANKNLARSLRINGTPAFIVGGKIIPGALDLGTLKKLISEAREE